jgi:secondary thiamine-phosphate synthase enzyme
MAADGSVIRPDPGRPPVLIRLARRPARRTRVQVGTLREQMIDEIRAARTRYNPAMVASDTLRISTRGQGDVHDLTGQVARAVSAAGLQSGVVTVFVTGSTAGITTIECEPGAVSDLDAAFERIAPRHANYAHHMKWGDENGSSHVRAAMLGPSVTIPVVGGRLALGTWQQVVVVEFDVGPRDRQVIVQIMGETIDDA